MKEEGFRIRYKDGWFVVEDFNGKVRFKSRDGAEALQWAIDHTEPPVAIFDHLSIEPKRRSKNEGN